MASEDSPSLDDAAALPPSGPGSEFIQPPVDLPTGGQARIARIRTRLPGQAPMLSRAKGFDPDRGLLNTPCATRPPPASASHPPPGDCLVPAAIAPLSHRNAGVQPAKPAAIFTVSATITVLNRKLSKPCNAATRRNLRLVICTSET